MPTKRTISQLYDYFAPLQEAGSITPDRVQDLIATMAVSDNMHVVRSTDDLPDPSGNEVTLPAKTVLFLDDVNIGSDHLRLSEGTVLRALAGASVVSTSTGGVVRAAGLDAAVIMREINIVAPAGPCLDLSGPIDQQLNLFFVGLFGASVGTVSGFDVQSFKQCFFDTADGITLTGTTSKVFISESPFYGITAGNAAVTFASGLNSRRVDIVNSFFKHDAAGIPLRADEGYTVGYGRVSGCMLDGPETMLDGLASSDLNWWFRENDLVRNSRVTAQSFLTEASTTVITTQGEFTPAEGPFTLTELTQRFTVNEENELVYTGVDPVTVTFDSSFNVDPSNNDRIAFRATKNGATLDYSQAIVEQGAGAGSSPRAGSVLALIEIDPGDRIGLAVANLEGTANIPWLSATYSVIA